MTTSSQAATPKPAVAVRGLSYAYGEHQVVSRVDLTITPGQVFALLGTNGAGKTTTLEAIQGYRRPQAGSIRVFGLDPLKDGSELRRRTGFMLQNAGLIGEQNVRESLGLWAQLTGRVDDVDGLLSQVEITHRADVRVDNLSGGERRRLDLAMAIWGGPDLVILDEPTTGLDPASRETLWRLVSRLRDLGSTILLTTHYLEEAQALADTVAIMHAGHVALQGSLEDVLASHATTARALVGPADITRGDQITTERFARDVAAAGWSVSREAGGLGVQAEVHDVHAQLHDLMSAVEHQRLRLLDLTITKASLEDIFHSVRHRAGQTPRETRESNDVRSLR